MPQRTARFLSLRAPFAKRLAAALLFLAGTALADGGEAPAAAAGAKDDRFGIWKPGMDGTPFLAVCTNAALPQSVRTEAAFRWLACTDWAGRTVSDFGAVFLTGWTGFAGWTGLVWVALTRAGAGRPGGFHAEAERGTPKHGRPAFNPRRMRSDGIGRSRRSVCALC